MSYAIEPKRYARGAQLTLKSSTYVPEEAQIKPRKDWLLVEPIDCQFSNHLIVAHETKPLRGIVRAVGPGTYPKKYDHPEKHKRTKMWESKHFQPTEVRVGDTVELGGLDIGGYSFESFTWGTRPMIMCREADVCGISESLDQGSAS